jgi:hypothetical protein
MLVRCFDDSTSKTWEKKKEKKGGSEAGLIKKDLKKSKKLFFWRQKKVAVTKTINKGTTFGWVRVELRN